MRRYLRIYRTFFITSLHRELEFRANFLAKVLQNVVWISAFIAIVLVIYSNTNSVAGWNRGDALTLSATSFVISSINSALFFSLMEIPEMVRKGTLDFTITKPVDSQFWVSTRRFNLDQIGTFLAGCAIVVMGIKAAGAHTSLVQWAAYACLVIAAVLIYYSFNLCLMTLGVWLVRVDNLWVLGETVIQIARYPLDIYGLWIRRLFLYVLPLGLLATVPAVQLVKGFNGPFLLLGVVWAASFFSFARWFWRYAMRHYTSASS